MEIQHMQPGQKFYGPNERVLTYAGTRLGYDPNRGDNYPIHFAEYVHEGQTYPMDFRATYEPALYIES
jgi:hypothetical protein